MGQFAVGGRGGGRHRTWPRLWAPIQQAEGSPKGTHLPEDLSLTPPGACGEALILQAHLLCEAVPAYTLSHSILETRLWDQYSILAFTEEKLKFREAYRLPRFTLSVTRDVR